MFRKLIKEQLLIESDEVRIKFKMDIPEDIRKIQKVFKSKGKDLYLVGGAVRDSLLKKPIKDWDLATDATPDEVIQMLKVESFITNLKLVGVRFGIVIAVTDTDEYEVATFQTRDESKLQDTGEVAVTFSDMKSDIARRDLTINALFYDLSTNEIIDLVGGVNDIKNNVIKSVGKARDRFEDDSIRKLRSIRFAARTGSKIDQDIDAELKRDPSIHPKVAAQPIKDEFIKGIETSKSTTNYLSMLDKYKLLDAIFPNMSINNNFIESNDPELVIASLLLPYINKDMGQLEDMLNSLIYSKKEIKAITILMLLTQFEPEDVLPMKERLELSTLSNEQIKNFSTLMGLDANLINKLLEFQLSVNGQEVMKQFNVKGEDVGKMINKLEVDNFIKTLT